MQSGTKKVLGVVLTITASIFIGSYFYYDAINKLEDPRITPAKQLFQEYDKELDSDEYVQALSLLDRMLAIYRATPGYEQSYEIGVLLNNKATVYLVEMETDLLTGTDVNRPDMQERLGVARDYTEQAIQLYRRWLDEMGSLSEEEIRKDISPHFVPSDPVFGDLDVEKVRDKRVDLIMDAQIETPRRVSVSLTNLGMINRYLGNLEEARSNYEAAIELWDRNYTAQDNLNILMNRPVQKRSLISRLFPPERTD